MFPDSTAHPKLARHSRRRRVHGLLGALIAYVSVVSIGVAAAAAVVGAGIPVDVLTASF